jgi:putative ABC transport system permease protein
VLKCLGLTPRQVLALYLGQTAALGLAGSLVGVAAGIALQLALPSVLGTLVPAGAIDPWQPAAIARGLGLGVGVALLFSLPPLAAVLRVPPARVLRRNAEPLPASRGAAAATTAVVALGLVLLAVAQSGSLLRGVAFTGGLALVTAALAGASLAVSRLADRLARRLGPGGRRFWLRHGLAALARPGAATLGAIVALGLGVLVVLGMSLVQAHLSERLAADLPRDAPTVFLVDVQPDQWPGVEALLEDMGATRIDSVPVVTARLTAIDGQGTGELAEEAEGGGRRWALSREQRLTYLEELPPDNAVVAGALWSDPQQPEVSVEQEFAQRLGVGVGSTLSLDVQGVPLTLAVTSLRSVDWESFGINFYLVVEPGVLEEAPQQRLAAARLPEGRVQALQDRLAAAFPNVTPLDIRQILEKILSILKQVGLGVRLLGGFTVLAGIAILAGAVSAAAARRGREVALLKTLGVTRAGVVAIFSVEYALVGLVAAAIGTAGAGVLAWAVITQGLELDWSLRPLYFATALAGGTLLAILAGLAASSRALSQRPVEVLRGE